MEIDRMYLTEKEVSLLTGRALSTLRNDRFKRKHFPYIKIGKSCRYRYQDVIAYMESRKIKIEET
jgi:predicted DNA-binding transcriptional regulator AlpA